MLNTGRGISFLKEDRSSFWWSGVLQNIQMKMSDRTLSCSGQFGSRIQEMPLESKLGGQDLEQFQSSSGCSTIVWTEKTFSRHQGMNRNGSTLWFSFTASSYPSELSLLIILICFCFNCFSGWLFTPGWGLQIPCCHSALYPQKTLLIEEKLPPLSPGDQQCSPPGVPSSNHQAELAQGMKPTSLLCPCPGLSSPMWNQLFVGLGVFFWDLFFLSFSKHAYTIFDISAHPWLPVLIWGFQFSNQGHRFNKLELWKHSRKVMGCELRQTWVQVLAPLPANLVTWACQLTSLNLCFHNCNMVKIISTFQDCLELN